MQVITDTKSIISGIGIFTPPKPSPETKSDENKTEDSPDKSLDKKE